MKNVAIGIDVGGTKIAGGLVGDEGEMSCEEVTPTPVGDPDLSATETLALINRLLGRAAAQGQTVKRAGVGVPEYVTPEGRISSALVLPSLMSLPSMTASGTPIVFGSDVRCAALAESRLGHGRDVSSFVFVILGTGISSTLVIEGRLWPGHRGEAIALGELPIDPALALRPDAPFTVEEQASGRAINQARASRTDPGDGPQRADVAHAVSEQAGLIVATALASVVRLLDPAAVITGGGLGTTTGHFFNSLAHNYALLTSNRPAPPPLLRAKLGHQAGVIGAGLLAHQGTEP